MRFGIGTDDEIKELKQQVAQQDAAIRALVGVLLDHYQFGYRSLSNSYGDLHVSLQPFAPESPVAMAIREAKAKNDAIG